MNFLKSKVGIFLILMVMIAAAIVIWHCFGGSIEKKAPNGTLVKGDPLFGQEYVLEVFR